MTPSPQRLLLAGLIAASLSAAAVAQTTPPPAPNAPTAAESGARAAPGDRRARMDPAERQKRMAEHHTQRMADLKSQLKLTPAQEGAWSQFSAAMQPPAQGRQRPDRAEFDKLTTPERIDRMQAMQAERQAQMKQRGDATKAFYAQLTPEQQKTFDDRAMRHGPQGKRGGGGHHGGMGGGPR